MRKHILVPTDGSTLSLRAAKHAVRFAQVRGARVTGTINLLRDDFHGELELHYSIASVMITCDTYFVAGP